LSLKKRSKNFVDVIFEPAIEVLAIPFQIGVVVLRASVALLRQHETLCKP